LRRLHAARTKIETATRRALERGGAGPVVDGTRCWERAADLGHVEDDAEGEGEADDPSQHHGTRASSFEPEVKNGRGHAYQDPDLGVSKAEIHRGRKAAIEVLFVAALLQHFFIVVLLFQDHTLIQHAKRHLFAFTPTHVMVRHQRAQPRSTLRVSDFRLHSLVFIF
jgi:hypothetical protein